MNRGTKSGNLAEIDFVKEFNLNKNSANFEDYFSKLNYNNYEDLYMVRVTTKQFSKLSNQVVMTRADAYLISSVDAKIKEILETNNYYIDEELLRQNAIKYNFINYSGISVKMSDSDKFQILKLTPDSFFSLFKEYELGAGASIYCKKEDELIKNKMVFNGWKTSKENVINKYCENIPELKRLETDISTSEQLVIYRALKDFCNKKITEKIDNSQYLKEIIFNGFHIYEEPYSASYFYKGGKIKKLNYIPFIITTGSGRSKGIFTIVLKPKNETLQVS